MVADSTNEAYYTMFHAAKALLALKNIYPKTHQGVVYSLSPKDSSRNCKQRV